jgi:RNA polymerase sigma-70 factor (ECF subfamily)
MVQRILAMVQQAGDVRAVESVQEGREDFVAICADEVAFRAWYDVAVHRVHAYLFTRTGGDHALSEELTQQAFVRAIRARASYDQRAPVTAWVCAIARNLLADHHRRKAREERSLLRVVVREIEPDVAVVESERQEVLATLRSLPTLQRAAIVLRYLDDLSVREVAAAIGKSESATESLLSRGRERFRRSFDEVEP